VVQNYEMRVLGYNIARKTSESTVVWINVSIRCLWPETVALIKQQNGHCPLSVSPIVHWP